MSFPAEWTEQAQLLSEVMAAGLALRNPTKAIDARAIRQALLTSRNRDEQPDPRGLVLEGATVRGGLDLSYFSTSVPLCFTNCTFSEHADFTAATLFSLRLKDCEFQGKTTSLRAEGVTVRGELTCDGLNASANGDITAVNLAAASVGKDLVVKNVRLESAKGLALDAGAISVAQVSRS